jgi:RimJ/RimL family protein N-acetyltransferase
MTESILPFTFSGPLVTDRLRLRLLTEADVDDVHAWMSDPDVARYQLYEPRSREVVAEKVREYSTAVTLAKDGDYLQPGIELPATADAASRVVGIVFFRLASVDDLTAEIGWALAAEFHGKGYAFEAASAVLDLAFRTIGLHRVYAELDPRNAASIALCERLGMRSEAYLVQNLMFKGEWADTGIYGILQSEWLAP